MQQLDEGVSSNDIKSHMYTRSLMWFWSCSRVSNWRKFWDRGSIYLSGDIFLYIAWSLIMSFKLKEFHFLFCISVKPNEVATLILLRSISRSFRRSQVRCCSSVKWQLSFLLMHLHYLCIISLVLCHILRCRSNEVMIVAWTPGVRPSKWSRVAEFTSEYKQIFKFVQLLLINAGHN